MFQRSFISLETYILCRCHDVLAMTEPMLIFWWCRRWPANTEKHFCLNKDMKLVIVNCVPQDNRQKHESMIQAKAHDEKEYLEEGHKHKRFWCHEEGKGQECRETPIEHCRSHVGYALERTDNVADSRKDDREENVTRLILSFVSFPGAAMNACAMWAE